MIMDQDFPGNVTIAVLSRSLKERFGGRHNNEQSCQKQRKNPRQKMERPENVLRSETTNRDTAFKITIRGKSPLLNGLLFEVIFTVFVPRLVLTNREGNLVFNIMYGKFWFDGDFFVPEIWTPVRSSASTSPFHKKVPFYFSWQNGTFFLRWAFFLFFLFFLLKTFFRF